MYHNIINIYLLIIIKIIGSKIPPFKAQDFWEVCSLIPVTKITYNFAKSYGIATIKKLYKDYYIIQKKLGKVSYSMTYITQKNKV